ncbi:FecR domain-containing protein [Candidatus Omnitrophota bacterium]
MKKVVTYIVMLFFIGCIASVSDASVDNVYEVAVVDITGDVEVDTKANGTWITPWVGMKLLKEAIIKTGSKSSADIVFDAEGLNVLHIRENSEVNIQDASVNLPEGSVLANFSNLKPGSSFVVQTPTAACGIRGSGMGVDVFNEITSVQAYEHSVYVQGLDASGNPIGKTVEIPEGWKSIVEAGGKIETPAELTDNEKQVFNAWVEAITGTPPSDAAVPGGTDTNDVDGKDLDDIKKEETKSDVSPCGSSSGGQQLVAG